MSNHRLTYFNWRSGCSPFSVFEFPDEKKLRIADSPVAVDVNVGQALSVGSVIKHILGLKGCNFYTFRIIILTLMAKA